MTVVKIVILREAKRSRRMTVVKIVILREAKRSRRMTVVKIVILREAKRSRRICAAKRECQQIHDWLSNNSPSAKLFTRRTQFRNPLT